SVLSFAWRLLSGGATLPSVTLILFVTLSFLSGDSPFLSFAWRLPSGDAAYLSVTAISIRLLELFIQLLLCSFLRFETSIRRCGLAFPHR
ncbi:hypothetical protein ACIQXF_19715, partial [Lysinibacillus sp. NPDC097231]|uniref:hypothetical protein n=1 Tax=Lysinibacillus sp. NPDC097231 TaxID=3364142 RepID=UPI00380A142E